MDREQFVRENPELAAKQDKAGNRGMLKVAAMVILGTALAVGTKKYCEDEEFRTKTNDIIEKFHYAAMRQFG